MEALPSDTWYQEVRAEIDVGCTLDGRFLGYSLESDGLLQHFGRIYVPVFGDLHTLIFSEAHHTLYSTHPSVKKMHVDRRKLYIWLGMRQNVVNFVA